MHDVIIAENRRDDWSVWRERKGLIWWVGCVELARFYYTID